MALNPLAPGLRVFHNSNSVRRVELVIPAGADMEVPVEVAEQLAASSTHFEVDADAVRTAKDAARDAARVAEQPADTTGVIEDAPARVAKPVKKAAKKATAAPEG